MNYYVVLRDDEEKDYREQCLAIRRCYAGSHTKVIKNQIYFVAKKVESYQHAIRIVTALAEREIQTDIVEAW